MFEKVQERYGPIEDWNFIGRDGDISVLLYTTEHTVQMNDEITEVDDIILEENLYDLTNELENVIRGIDWINFTNDKKKDLFYLSITSRDKNGAIRITGKYVDDLESVLSDVIRIYRVAVNTRGKYRFNCDTLKGEFINGYVVARPAYEFFKIMKNA